MQKKIAYNGFLITAMNKDLGCVDMNLAVRENSTVFKQGESNVHPCGISHDVICSMSDVEKNSFKVDLANV